MADTPSAALPETRVEEILSPALRESIARVDGQCRMRPLGMPDDTGPLPTIYELLTMTREQGTDIPRAMDHAMSNYSLLSHEQRLLAIVLARALPEIETLRDDRDRLQRRVEEQDKRWQTFKTAVLATDDAFQKIASVLDEIDMGDVSVVMREAALALFVSVQDDSAALTPETPHAK